MLVIVIARAMSAGESELAPGHDAPRHEKAGIDVVHAGQQ
jgi:hypothetical protein